MHRYQWAKGFFKRRLEITQGSAVIGYVQWESLLGAKAHGNINGRRFFLNREFFLSKLEIYDATTEDLLGTIMINMFNPKSNIVINGKCFELEIENFWQSRWAWKFNGEELIAYTSTEFMTKDKGTIEIFTANTEEIEILLLLGLFVRNQLILFMLLILVLILVVVF